jgi:putative phosphoesterase
MFLQETEMALIGLMSDVHSTPAAVAEALSIFRKSGVDEVFCAGDIAGYRDGVVETVELLAGNRCRAILGNHDQGYLAEHGDDPDDAVAAYFRGLPAFIDTRIEGKRIYVVHAEPPAACHGGIRLRDRTGAVQPDRVAHWAERLAALDCDVLVVGHTHQVFAEPVGDMLVVNPGSTAFNHSCAILSLPDMQVEVFPLSGKAVREVWQWGDHLKEDT